MVRASKRRHKMTCTTATQFAPHRRGSVLDGLIRRFEEWNNRRALYKVLQLDPHLLRDIGLTHGDVERAIGERLSEDAGQRLMATRNPHVT
ncbi:MAG: DUF1127 domain-containing protein [Rhodobacteraceae bacterium]|nr:DUF1127 domain-containing protein [Paracoccaceae bacterium]